MPRASPYAIVRLDRTIHAAGSGVCVCTWIPPVKPWDGHLSVFTRINAQTIYVIPVLRQDRVRKGTDRADGDPGARPG